MTKKPKFREKLRYWFDNRMAKGPVSLVKVLAIATILVVVLITVVITALNLQEDSGFFETFWDSLSTTINAWMPSSEDGGPGYVVLMALAAIAGLLVTSVLIGIVGSAIEERLGQLRKGNSRVLEKDHIVVLGYHPGECSLITQLGLAAAGEKRCIVIAEEMDKEEMEDSIRENVSLPRSVQIICRNIDICDPAAVAVCGIDSCRTVVIAPGDDARTLRCMLAVTSITERAGRKIPVICSASDPEFLLSSEEQARRGVIMLQTRRFLARMMAHTCTQPGLSDVMLDVFDFGGAEFYASEAGLASGRTFAETVRDADGCSVVGILRDGEMQILPSPDTELNDRDRIVFFGDTRKSVCLDVSSGRPSLDHSLVERSAGCSQIALIGQSSQMELILNELPDNLDIRIRIADDNEEKREVRERCEGRERLHFSGTEWSTETPFAIEDLTRGVDHVLLLSDDAKEEAEADTETMLQILQLRDIRRRLGLSFSMTAEMRSERSRRLIASDDATEFIVASDMTSLLLAQISESPELLPFFRELLSNIGCELYLKDPRDFGIRSNEQVRDLRMRALGKGYAVIGYRIDPGTPIIVNPKPGEIVPLPEGASLLVLGRN